MCSLSVLSLFTTTGAEKCTVLIVDAGLVLVNPLAHTAPIIKYAEQYSHYARMCALVRQ